MIRAQATRWWRGTALLLAAGSLAACDMLLREPSGADMRAAMMQQFEGTNAKLAALARSCQKSDVSAASVEGMTHAMQCLSLCAVGNPKCEVKIGIAAFRKVGCRSAAPDAGYRCEFTVTLSGNSAVTQLGLGLVNDASIQAARFVRTDGRWQYFAQAR